MRPWAFKLDYVAAIAADEARVAFLSSETTIRVAREIVPELERLAGTSHGMQCAYWSAYDVMTYKLEGMLERAALLGVSRDELRGWVLIRDDSFAWEESKKRDEIAAVLGKPTSADYLLGRAVSKRLGEETGIAYIDETRRKKHLAKAKSDLARHRRNKIKWGEHG